MDKPLIIELREFTQELADVINSHSKTIPFELMADKMQMVLNKVNEEAQKQYSLTEVNYKKKLQEKGGEESNE